MCSVKKGAYTGYFSRLSFQESAVSRPVSQSVCHSLSQSLNKVAQCNLESNHFTTRPYPLVWNTVNGFYQLQFQPIYYFLSDGIEFKEMSVQPTLKANLKGVEDKLQQLVREVGILQEQFTVMSSHAKRSVGSDNNHTHM